MRLRKPLPKRYTTRHGTVTTVRSSSAAGVWRVYVGKLEIGMLGCFLFAPSMLDVRGAPGRWHVFGTGSVWATRRLAIEALQLADKKKLADAKRAV